MDNTSDMLRRIDEIERRLRPANPSNTTVLTPKAKSIDSDGHWLNRTTAEALAAGLRETVLCSDGYFVAPPA